MTKKRSYGGIFALGMTAALGTTACSDNGGTDTQDMAQGTTGDMATGGTGDMAMVVKNYTRVGQAGGFTQPAAVTFDTATMQWFVSNAAANIGSNPTELAKKDHKGSIGTISADRQTVNPAWYPVDATTGLNHPLGLQVSGGYVFVADVDQLVAIKVSDKATLRSMTLPMVNLLFLGTYPSVLSDVALDSTGTVYATELIGQKMYSFASPKAANNAYAVFPASGGRSWSRPSTLFLDGTTKFVVGENFDPITMKAGGMWSIDNTGKNPMQLGTTTGYFVGIEKDGNDYLVADNNAVQVMRIDSTTGAVSKTYNFKVDGLQGIGSIAYEPTSKTLAVPDLGTNTVYFYTLQ